MIHIYRLLYVSIFLFVGISLSAQTLVYKGYKGNDYIGDMIVSRQVDGNKTHLKSDAQLTVKFLLTWEMRFYYEAEFQEGVLQRSEVKLSRDGKLRTHVHGQKTGTRYKTSVDGEPVETSSDIDYCVLNTYYESPTGRKKIFSERWGDYIEIEEKSPGTFILTPPNGSENTLIYKNGICKEMQFNHTLAKVRFVLKE